MNDMEKMLHQLRGAAILQRALGNVEAHYGKTDILACWICGNPIHAKQGRWPNIDGKDSCWPCYEGFTAQPDQSEEEN